MSSIEEVVIDIQNGMNRKNELFSLIKGYVYKICSRYYPLGKEKGYELEDLVSVAWFGIEKAVKVYQPEKGYKFITYLKFHIRNSIAEFLGFRGPKQIRTISLDEIVPGTEELTIGDTIEDETQEALFDQAEYKVLGEEIWQEIDRLPENEGAVLAEYYKRNKSYNTIAEDLGVSGERVRQIKQKALRKLRASPYMRQYGAEYFAFRHTTLQTFKNTHTSSTEWAVLKVLTQEEAKKTCQNLTYKT